MKKHLLLISALILWIVTAKAAYTSYYVSLSGSSTATGLSPTAPCSDLQKIFTQFAAGDTVKICTGTYESPSTGLAFKIIDKWIQTQGVNVVVRGGYSSDFKTWNPVLYPTVIKANAMNKESIFYIYSCNIIMEGLTIYRRCSCK